MAKAIAMSLESQLRALQLQIQQLTAANAVGTVQAKKVVRARIPSVADAISIPDRKTGEPVKLLQVSGNGKTRWYSEAECRQILDTIDDIKAFAKS
jgi:hypothetical protein